MSRTRYAQDGKSSPAVFEKKLKEWAEAVAMEVTVRERDQMSTAELKQLKALEAMEAEVQRKVAERAAERAAQLESETGNVVEVVWAGGYDYQVVVRESAPMGFWRRVWKVVSGY